MQDRAVTSIGRNGREIREDRRRIRAETAGYRIYLAPIEQMPAVAPDARDRPARRPVVEVVEAPMASRIYAFVDPVRQSISDSVFGKGEVEMQYICVDADAGDGHALNLVCSQDFGPIDQDAQCVLALGDFVYEQKDMHRAVGEAVAADVRSRLGDLGAADAKIEARDPPYRIAEKIIKARAPGLNPRLDNWWVF